MSRATLLLLACVPVFTAPGAGWAPGGQPPAEVGAPHLEADAVLRELLAAYRGGPVAERVTIRVRQPPPPDMHGPVLDRESVATVRVHRGRGDEDRVLRADLGVLSVYAHGDALVIVRSDDPSVCLRRRLSGPVSARALAPVLPPTALPAIALALGDAAAAANLTPFTRGVRWRIADGAPRETGLVRLSGHASGGEATLLIDAVTHRLRELSFRAASGARLDVRCEAIEPGDPGAWAIDADDRRVVRSLRDLGVPEAPFARGEPVPALPLQDMETDLWALEDEFAARAAADPRRTPAPAILVLARQRVAGAPAAPVPGSVAGDAVRAYLRKQRRLAAEHDNAEERGGVPFWRPVLVFEVEEFTRERLAGAAERWKSSLPIVSGPFDGAEPECLWSSAGRPLLDRFVRGSDTVVAVIGSDGVLIGAFGVAPSDTRENVEARLASVFEQHARELIVGPPEPK